MEMMRLAIIAATIAATMAIIIIQVTMGLTLEALMEVVRMDLARLPSRQTRLMEANMDIIGIIEAEAVVTKTVMKNRLGRSGLRNFLYTNDIYLLRQL